MANAEQLGAGKLSPSFLDATSHQPSVSATTHSLTLLCFLGFEARFPLNLTLISGFHLSCLHG